MRIRKAYQQERTLYVEVDGHTLYATETKYTILQLGYAVYLCDGVDEEWIRKNGETVPEDKSDGRSSLPSGRGILFTSDPILFALCYEHWHGGWVPPGETLELALPLVAEALEILQNCQRLTSTESTEERRLLENIRRFHRNSALEYYEPYEPGAGGRDTPLELLGGRLERAAINHATSGEAAESHYAIWAETIRGILGSVHEDIVHGRNIGRRARLRICMNTLAAFSELQRMIVAKRTRKNPAP